MLTGRPQGQLYLFFLFQLTDSFLCGFLSIFELLPKYFCLLLMLFSSSSQLCLRLLSLFLSFFYLPAPLLMFSAKGKESVELSLLFLALFEKSRLINHKSSRLSSQLFAFDLKASHLISRGIRLSQFGS